MPLLLFSFNGIKPTIKKSKKLKNKTGCFLPSFLHPPSQQLTSPEQDSWSKLNEVQYHLPPLALTAPFQIDDKSCLQIKWFHLSTFNSFSKSMQISRKLRKAADAWPCNLHLQTSWAGHKTCGGTFGLGVRMRKETSSFYQFPAS